MNISRGPMAALLVATGLMTVGCASNSPNRALIDAHIISADADGAAIDPLTGERLDVHGETVHYRKRIKKILAAADERAASRADGGRTRWSERQGDQHRFLAPVLVLVDAIDDEFGNGGPGNDPVAPLVRSG